MTNYDKAQSTFIPVSVIDTGTGTQFGVYPLFTTGGQNFYIQHMRFTWLPSTPPEGPQGIFFVIALDQYVTKGPGFNSPAVVKQYFDLFASRIDLATTPSQWVLIGPNSWDAHYAGDGLFVPPASQIDLALYSPQGASSGSIGILGVISGHYDNAGQPGPSSRQVPASISLGIGGP